jgi:hypothetical protein
MPIVAKRLFGRWAIENAPKGHKTQRRKSEAGDPLPEEMKMGNPLAVVMLSVLEAILRFVLNRAQAALDK